MSDQPERNGQSISKMIISGTGWPIQDKFTFSSKGQTGHSVMLLAFLMLSSTWLMTVFPTISHYLEIAYN